MIQKLNYSKFSKAGLVALITLTNCARIPSLFHQTLKLYVIDLDPNSTTDDLAVQGELSIPPDSQTREKLESIAQGVNHVEQFFSQNLVDVLTITPSKEANASASPSSPQIIFTSAYFRRPLQDFHVMAEHETLHRAMIQTDCASGSDIREFVADIQSYQKLERDLFLKSGVLPITRIYFPYIHHFFEFINESSYFRAGQGHSQDNTHEFCASMSHALMYPDLLGENIQTYPVEQQREFLQLYQRAAQLIDPIRFSFSKKTAQTLLDHIP